MASLQRNFAIALVLVAQAFAQGCGAGNAQPGTPAGSSRDEERANNLLERARASKDTEHYRRLITRFPDTQAANDGREELGTLLVAEAQRAFAQKDYSTADDRAEEATRFTGLEMTEKARGIQKQIDEARAERIAKKASDAAGQGKCASAMKLVAAPLREKPRDRFKEVVQEKSKEALSACLLQRLNDEIKAGNIEAARTALASPDATTALDKKAWSDVETAMKKAIVGRATSAIKPLLDAQKWSEAFAKIDEIEKSGKLSAAERPVAREIVRDAIASHVQEWAKAAMSAKRPSELAKKIDEAIKAGGWQKTPDALETARANVALAVECEKLRCKLVKPSAGWSWGAIDVHPPASASGEAVSKLTHAQQVWVLAKSPTATLIATEDPGAAEGPALFEKATGWVDARNLKPSDTSLWLPPTDQLVGVRVWAPLRAPSKDYHLGTVKKVAGRKVTVERMADKTDVEVDLGAIRVGALSKGLKVMAFCVDQVHPESAKVDAVVSEQGVPRVQIACDKGDVTRVEIGSALVTKAEWLPPKKP